MADLSNRWMKSMVSGGNLLSFLDLLSFPAIASADGKHSIVCLSHQLRVYFLQTRQCIRTVDVNLSQAVAVHLDPGSENQIVVFTASEIFYVNWSDKVESVILARQRITPPFGGLPFGGLQSVFKTTATKHFAAAKDESSLRIIAIDRETAIATQVTKIESVDAFAISADGHKLVVVLDSGSISLYDISAVVSDLKIVPDFESALASVEATKEFFKLRYKTITCLTVSNSGVIAFGTSAGIINLIYGGSSTGKPQRTLRWHIDRVKALCFSADEVYLVSGGNENVLVFWHVELGRTQFLPRLAGPIDCIFVDKNRPDHYTVALQITENSHDEAPAHELLTILAVDLISRLSVNSARPNFAVSVLHAVNAPRPKQRGDNGDFRTVSHDVTALLVVHPTTKHIYFVRGSAIQAYDVVRGEQAFVQHAVSQILTGRVKSEWQLRNAVVSSLAFTEDGKWMATFDSMPMLDFDNLLLKKDVAYALKFWHWKNSSWLLSLKIVDPHGAGIDVGAIITPGDDSFTTVDKQGGIRVWKPRANHVGSMIPTAATAYTQKMMTQTVWTLRRASPPTSTKAAVSACYSPDRSLLCIAHGFSARIHDPMLLRATDFVLPTMDLQITALLITGPYLIIVSERKIVLFHLVSARETELCAKVSAPGAHNLIAVDATRQLIAMATNQYCDEPELLLRGKVLIFRPDSVVPIHVFQHPLAIASLVCTSSGFLFVDTDCRIGVIAPEFKQDLGEDDLDDLSTQMSKMLVSAQATANVLFAHSVVQGNAPSESSENSDKCTSHKAIDVAILQPIFSNIEGVSLDSLFERVVRAVQ